MNTQWGYWMFRLLLIIAVISVGNPWSLQRYRFVIWVLQTSYSDLRSKRRPSNYMAPEMLKNHGTPYSLGYLFIQLFARRVWCTRHHDASYGIFHHKCLIPVTSKERLIPQIVEDKHPHSGDVLKHNEDWLLLTMFKFIHVQCSWPITSVCISAQH